MSSVFVGDSQVDGVSMDRSTTSTIRIACIAIAAYDFILTFPAEWRIYRGPQERFSFRASALLFFLVRYLSVVLIISGSYLFWGGGSLSDSACHRLSIVPPIFRCLQTMVVQLIMGWRTYNISRQRKPVLYILVTLYLVVISVQWVTNFYGRTVSRSGGLCSVITGVVQWVFYLCCVIWDATTLSLSLFYLSRIQTTSPFMVKLTRTMLVDGLVYFVAMTAINALNMLIFIDTTQTVIQGSVVIAYTSAMILSQRILINLSSSASENRNSSTNRTRTVTVSVPHSAEELGMEISSRIRSTAEQTEPTSGDSEQRYRGRARGTAQSTSGEFLDSVIEIDIAPVKSTSDEVNRSGPSRERRDHDDDSLSDFPTDSGIGTNRPSFPRRNEGPLMTTRRY